MPGVGTPQVTCTTREQVQRASHRHVTPENKCHTARYAPHRTPHNTRVAPHARSALLCAQAPSRVEALASGLEAGIPVTWPEFRSRGR
eukprot:1104776-Rhodomonas_salina.1